MNTTHYYGDGCPGGHQPPQGYGLEQFLPLCTCGHPDASHKHYPKGKPRRKWQVGTPAECACREYTAGDPRDWPPYLPPQQAL